MSEQRFTLIDDGRPVHVSAVVADGRVRLSWPVGGDALDLADRAALAGRPLALDLEERVACLGVSARERNEALASLRAPDFTLPDLEGRRHSLADQRGRKVLLVAYASW